MEILAAQPRTVESYDRYLRNYNDATTWLAETLDGSMRTPFEYRFDGQRMIADDGSSIETILSDSIVAAEKIVQKTPHLEFELRRRRLEYEEHGWLCEMATGEAPNTMVVISDFPPELMEASQDVGGYNVTRKQTMLRVFTWDGQAMKMNTQTLDRSDRAALEALYDAFGHEPKAGELLGQRLHFDIPVEDHRYVTDRLMGVYDRALARQYGGQWFAGRQELPHDTYQFVCSQTELVDRYVIAEMNGTLGERERFNIAALLTERFERAKQPDIITNADGVIRGAFQQDLELQLRRAGAAAVAAGRTFSGCGISAGGVLSGNEQLETAGYGNQSQEHDADEKGPLTFKCKKGHTNRRPRGKLISQCHVKGCIDSVGC